MKAISFALMRIGGAPKNERAGKQKIEISGNNG